MSFICYLHSPPSPANRLSNLSDFRLNGNQRKFFVFFFCCIRLNNKYLLQRVIGVAKQSVNSQFTHLHLFRKGNTRSKNVFAANDFIILHAQLQYRKVIVSLRCIAKITIRSTNKICTLLSLSIIIKSELI